MSPKKRRAKKKVGADQRASLKARLEGLQVTAACHDAQIQALLEVVRCLRERPGGNLMLPAITYPAPHPVKRRGITGGPAAR